MVATLRTVVRLRAYTALRVAAAVAPAVAVAIALASAGHAQPDLNKWF